MTHATWARKVSLCIGMLTCYWNTIPQLQCWCSFHPQRGSQLSPNVPSKVNQTKSLPFIIPHKSTVSFCDILLSFAMMVCLRLLSCPCLCHSAGTWTNDAHTDDNECTDHWNTFRCHSPSTVRHPSTRSFSMVWCGTSSPPKFLMQLVSIGLGTFCTAEVCSGESIRVPRCTFWPHCTTPSVTSGPRRSTRLAQGLSGDWLSSHQRAYSLYLFRVLSVKPPTPGSAEYPLDVVDPFCELSVDWPQSRQKTALPTEPDSDSSALRFL